MVWLAFEKFDDEGGDEGFFVWFGFGDEEGEGGEGAIANFGFAAIREVEVIDGKEDDEEEGADAFVAVVEGVVFDDEVEEVRGFFGDGFIEVFTFEALVDRGERGVETAAAGFAEELAGFGSRAEVIN